MNFPLMRKAVCNEKWQDEPRLVEGELYSVVHEHFKDGEWFYRLLDSKGKLFDVPSAFMSRPMRVRKVMSAGWSRDAESMGTLVDEGILHKEYEASWADTKNIIWSNISADVIVENDYETILPGQHVVWEK
tara:strand:+ start:3258 stop:3650 length:393 start_codon:yes stop_codon:yes gene_type:complete